MFGMLLFLVITVAIMLACGLAFAFYTLGRKVERTKIGLAAGLGAWLTGDLLHKTLQLFGLVETSKNACSAKYSAQEACNKVDGLEELAKQGASELDQKIDRCKAGSQRAESELRERLMQMQRDLDLLKKVAEVDNLGSQQ